MNIRIDTVARVRQLAAERNISLSRLSRECGINHSTIAITRARGGQLQVDTIYKICDFLGITIADFFTLPDELEDISQSTCEPLRIHNTAPSA